MNLLWYSLTSLVSLLLHHSARKPELRRPYDSGYEVHSPGAAVLGIDALDKTNAKDNNKRSSNLWKSRHTQNPSIATTAY